jgi:hypothetical protein
MSKEAPASVYWPLLRANFNGNPGVEVIRRPKFAIRSPRAESEGFMNEIR